jgi:hypothetical protein
MAYGYVRSDAKHLPSSACGWSGHPLAVIYRKLGGSKAASRNALPPNLHGEWNIDGWKVVVKRSAPPSGRNTRTARARIFVRVDGKLIPAGRVRQALCPEDRLDAARRNRDMQARRFKQKFGRMTPAEMVAHDAKLEKRSKKTIKALLEQKELKGAKTRRRR